MFGVLLPLLIRLVGDVMITGGSMYNKNVNHSLEIISTMKYIQVGD